nr:MAG TPA: hypothetical protein [Crassvirales sp.]
MLNNTLLFVCTTYCSIFASHLVKRCDWHC